MDKEHGVDSSVIRELAGSLEHGNGANAMRHDNTLFHQILKLIPWGAFERSVDKHDADRGVRTLTTKSHFVALLHGQLGGAESLRDMVTRMEPSKPSLPSGCHRTKALDARRRQCAASRGRLRRAVRGRAEAGQQRIAESVSPSRASHRFKPHLAQCLVTRLGALRCDVRWGEAPYRL